MTTYYIKKNERKKEKKEGIVITKDGIRLQKTELLLQSIGRHKN